MFDARDLKSQIAITQSLVECPVDGCSNHVERQRKVFRRKKQFQCPTHKIFISPSTFEYPKETDNLLWKDTSDLALFNSIKKYKRESRISRDNSEDALTWNVFRYLEKNNQLAELLFHTTNSNQPNPEIIYWSYSQRKDGVWPELTKARIEFGEHLQRSSEPDLIVKTERSLFFIEAKFTATNKTVPSNPKAYKKYLTGGDDWYRNVFQSDYETVALESRKYELLRFWLLGTWIASQINRDFYLVNLVLGEREKSIEAHFVPHINVSETRKFLRLTWEEIYQYIGSNLPNESKNKMITYFKYKAVGYNHVGELQPAFNISNGILYLRNENLNIS